MHPRNFGSEKIVRTGNRGLFCMNMRDRWTSDVHGGSPQGLPSSKWRVSKLSLTVGGNGYFSTDQDDFMTAKSREFVTQLIISKPLPSFSWGKPIGWPSSPGISLVSFSTTSSSFSSTKNLIFFRPRPACCKICFSEEDGTLHACRSAKHTNWPVHVRRDGFFLLADFEVPEPFSRRLLYGWKSLLLSSINCWAWEEPTELVEATFVRLSPSANCLQFSLRRTRSPKVSTPRRIRQLSDIARITCGSIFPSENRLESVESPTFWRMDFILFQNGGIRGNEGAWKLTFLWCIVGISIRIALLIKLFVLLITLLLKVNAALRSTSSQP